MKRQKLSSLGSSGFNQPFQSPTRPWGGTEERELRHKRGLLPAGFGTGPSPSSTNSARALLLGLAAWSWRQSRQKWKRGAAATESTGLVAGEPSVRLRLRLGAQVFTEN